MMDMVAAHWRDDGQLTWFRLVKRCCKSPAPQPVRFIALVGHFTQREPNLSFHEKLRVMVSAFRRSSIKAYEAVWNV